MKAKVFGGGGLNWRRRPTDPLQRKSRMFRPVRHRTPNTTLVMRSPKFILSWFSFDGRNYGFLPYLRKYIRPETFSGTEQNSSRIKLSEQNVEQNKRILRAVPAGRISHFRVFRKCRVWVRGQQKRKKRDNNDNKATKIERKTKENS